VFTHGRTPWIDPDQAAAEDIVAVINRCPSGALRYTVNGEVGPRHAEPVSIHIRRNGPYEVKGSVALRTSFWCESASREIYSLCRCGASRNKPFCDGSHWRVKFTDEHN
jgi:hypothetical protein